MTARLNRKLRVGIPSHPFQLTMGGTDFLRALVRGLATESSLELVFLCPPAARRLETLVPGSLRRVLGRIGPLRTGLRRVEARLEPAAMLLGSRAGSRESDFQSACPAMDIVTCAPDGPSIAKIARSLSLDVLIPVSDPVPGDIPIVTYWADCQPDRFPQFFGESARRAYRSRIRSLLATRGPMIINSKSAKEDMVNLHGADRDRVLELPFAPIVDCEDLLPHPEVAARYELEGPYAMVCNQFWRHKSLETAIEAARVARDRGIPLRLVFTGRMEEPRQPGYADSLRRLVRRHRLERRVRFLGLVPKRDQLELMKGAVAVVQPTLFEGGPGGGSSGDAIGLGVRVVASDIEVNRELPVEAGRVELFRVGDAEDLLARLQSMLNTEYRRPPDDELLRKSAEARGRLGRRLREAIDLAWSARDGGIDREAVP